MKFIIIDDEVHSDKFNLERGVLKDIYEEIISGNAQFYLCDPDRKNSTADCEFSDSVENSQILCFTSTEHIQKDMYENCVLMAVDLNDGQNTSSYFDFIKERLGEQIPVFMIALSGDIDSHEGELKELKKEYPYLEWYKKEQLEEAKDNICLSCKAIHELQKVINNLHNHINSQASKIYPDFLAHAEIIAGNPESGSRYMTSVVKEALYDGKYMDTKHFHFESYIPVRSNFTVIKSCYPKAKDYRGRDSVALSFTIDSDFRFGLILKSSTNNIDSYFVNITPSCNIHKIKEGKIQHIQLLELIFHDASNTDSLKGEHIYGLQPYLQDKSTSNDQPQLKCWHIDFTKISNVKFEGILHYEKVTLIIESVSKDVQQKFSSYYGRQGSIDFS